MTKQVASFRGSSAVQIALLKGRRVIPLPQVSGRRCLCCKRLVGWRQSPFVMGPRSKVLSETDFAYGGIPLRGTDKRKQRTESASILPFGRRLYGQNQEPRENRANQNCYLSGTEQAGHAASHICVGSTHVSALSFLSLLVRICTPGPGHNRVRRFTFNDDHGQRQRVG